MKNIVQKDIKTICKRLYNLFGTDKYDSIERLGGLSNRTYKVVLEDGKAYVIRIPGEGTEKLINRSDEKKSTFLANELEIDAKCLYFGDDGVKVSEYINCAVTMSAEYLKQEKYIICVADILRKLHGCGRSTGITFDVFDRIEDYEKLICEYNVSMYEDYNNIKQCVMQIKKETDCSCDIVSVPCHNDPLCENWVYGVWRMYLIDWEYSGMNDAMWDLAEVSTESGFQKKHDDILLTHYLGREPVKEEWKHFYAFKIFVDFFWTLWGKTRVPFDGKMIDEWADERYVRAQKNIKLYREL